MDTEYLEQLVSEFTAAVDAARAEELNGRDGSMWWEAANRLAMELMEAGADFSEGWIVDWTTA